MKTINCRGKLIDLRLPIVMGIINVNSDSFYIGSRSDLSSNLVIKANQMITEGASILDLGGVSTRPGAENISIQEEMDRVLPALEVLMANCNQPIVSIDTRSAKVAEEAIRMGASMINDISGGDYDSDMIPTVFKYQTPIVVMHMKGEPKTMKSMASYSDVTLEVLDDLIQKIGRLSQIGIKDIIIDPGFGFAKTIDQNYEILRKLEVFTIPNRPILVGLSRKSMFWKPLNTAPDHVLSATIAAQMVALQKGASILRVHDVLPAMQTIEVYKSLYQNINDI